MSAQPIAEHAARPDEEMFDRWAEVYDSRENPFFLLEQSVLKDVLPDLRNLNVLDAGCGTGRLFEFLQQSGAQRVVGIDNSSAMVRHAEARGIAHVVRGSCDALPLPSTEFDVVISSFVLSYVSSLEAAAAEMIRVCRPGATAIVSDMHPDTAHKLGWKRSFRYENEAISLPWFRRGLIELVVAFERAGWVLEICEERGFSPTERPLFERAGRGKYLDEIQKYPALFVLRFRKPDENALRVSFTGARCANSAKEATVRNLLVEGENFAAGETKPVACHAIPMDDMLLLPGLINAHDHLEFALYTRMGNGPYKNATEWANDIHQTYVEEIVRQKRVPRETRLLWGAVRNLLCGVTTVCEHNPLSTVMLGKDFPVEVIRGIRWAHSLAVETDLRARAAEGDAKAPFILHAAEGIDAQASSEFDRLHSMGLIDSQVVLVHGLAMNKEQARVLNAAGGAIVFCPSSNQFLFSRTPSEEFVASLENSALGSDSPLTAEGDLLDEVRFARNIVGIDAESLYEMVTAGAAKILGLVNGGRGIAVDAPADFVAILDRADYPADALCKLSWRDVQLVVRKGRIFLASDRMFKRLPETLQEGLERLLVEGEERWVRAPLKKMFEQASCVSQDGALTLDGREVRYGGA